MIVSRLSEPRTTLQLVMVGAVVTGAGITYSLHPTTSAEALGATAIACGVLVAVIPDEPLPTACLMLLMTQFATAFSSLSRLERVWAPLVVASILYVAHSAAELLRVIDKHSLVERRVLVRSAKRTGTVIGLATIVGAVMTSLSTVAKPAAWMLVVTIAAAVALMATFANWLVGQDKSGTANSEPVGRWTRRRRTNGT